MFGFHFCMDEVVALMAAVLSVRVWGGCVVCWLRDKLKGHKHDQD